MAPRAYWKGYLRLSLVQCPVALFPATTESEKIRFNQINTKTGNRIRYLKVDAESGEEVDSEDIAKGFEVAKGEYVLVTEEELESVALESKHIIDIDEFVPKDEIDDLYKIRPYYIAPDGNAGEDAFVVIRDIIERMDCVALGRIVIASREHVIALEPRGKGLMGTLLRFPYEVREAGDLFDGIADVKLPKDMFELAEHIVKTKSGHFHPEKFKDHYENALRELIGKKQKGERIEAEPRAKPTNVVNLMDALRRSVEAERGGRSGRRSQPAAQRRAPRRSARSHGRRKAG